MINELNPNQIFVFGSNLAGRHGGGAAKQAYEQFGAIMGEGIGLMGQSYAIPTLDSWHDKLPLIEIRRYINQLVEHAKEHTNLEFLLTPIGQGIAGFTKEEIESIMPELPPNIIKVNW